MEGVAHSLVHLGSDMHVRFTSHFKVLPMDVDCGFSYRSLGWRADDESDVHLPSESGLVVISEPQIRMAPGIDRLKKCSRVVYPNSMYSVLLVEFWHRDMFD